MRNQRLAKGLLFISRLKLMVTAREGFKYHIKYRKYLDMGQSADDLTRIDTKSAPSDLHQLEVTALVKKGKFKLIP